jgi:hypothetical protein
LSGYVRGLTEHGAGYDIAAGRYYVLSPPNARAEAFLDGRYERDGEGRWKARKGTVKKLVSSFARSAASGRATDDVIATRRRACFGDGATPACALLTRTSSGAFCGECNCPRSPLARMDGDGFKITRAFLECPRRLPGP